VVMSPVGRGPENDCVGNRDSLVGIATGFGMDDQGVRVRVPVGSRRPDRLWGSSSIISNGYFTGSKADHSPTSADVKKMWNYTYIPPHGFMV
jgi:hypothetical protein